MTVGPRLRSGASALPAGRSNPGSSGNPLVANPGCGPGLPAWPRLQAHWRRFTPKFTPTPADSPRRATETLCVALRGIHTRDSHDRFTRQIHTPPAGRPERLDDDRTSVRSSSSRTDVRLLATGSARHSARLAILDAPALNKSRMTENGFRDVYAGQGPTNRGRRVKFGRWWPILETRENAVCPLITGESDHVERM